MRVRSGNPTDLQLVTKTVDKHSKHSFLLKVFLIMFKLWPLENITIIIQTVIKSCQLLLENEKLFLKLSIINLVIFIEIFLENNLNFQGE
jgi:uncharacterized membrane protein